MRHEFSQGKVPGSARRLGNYVASPLAAAAFMFWAVPGAATVCSDLVGLSLPNTTITSTQFARITPNQFNFPRTGQVGVRVTF